MAEPESKMLLAIGRRHHRLFKPFIAVGIVFGAAITLPSDALCQIKVSDHTALYCDGSFETTLEYTGSAKPIQYQGSFGSTVDFSKIAADKMNPVIPGIVIISGALKNSCKAGLTDFALAGSIKANVTVRDSPFQIVMMPLNPVKINERRDFQYQIELIPCAAFAGMKVTFKAEGSAASIPEVSVEPKTVRLPAAGKQASLSVTGKLSPDESNGNVVVSVTDPAAATCRFKSTEVSE